MKPEDKLWAIYDVKGAVDGFRKGCFKVNSYAEAKELNKHNYGIFWTPNDFDGARKEENLTRINYYYCDIDGGDKESQMAIIREGLMPTFIIESKNGYHCYWKAKDATPEGFKRVEQGIVKRLGADPKATDTTRLLRMPSFWHCKDPNDRFMVRCVYKSDKEFKESYMLATFPLPPERKYTYKPTGDVDFIRNPDNWEKVFKLSRIQEGGRNSMLKDQVYKAYMNGVRGGELLSMALAMNSRIAKPLPNHEVVNMTRGLR